LNLIGDLKLVSPRRVELLNGTNDWFPGNMDAHKSHIEQFLKETIDRLSNCPPSEPLDGD
jgi:hypothetical protein